MRSPCLADYLPEERSVRPLFENFESRQEFRDFPTEITRQLRDNLFFLSNFQSLDGGNAYSEAQIESYLRMAHWYALCTSNGNGFQSRRNEFNRSGAREPIANHPMRVVDVGLGLLDRMMRERKIRKAWDMPELPELEAYKSIEEQPLQFALTLLLHDCFEDASKFEERTSRGGTSEKLQQVLLYTGAIESSQVDSVIQEVMDAVRTVSYLEEDQAAYNHDEHLNGIWQKPLCRLAKGSDIIQNAFSQHTEKQQKKYQDLYVDYLIRLLSIGEYRPYAWLNQNLINRMITANPYLEKVFAEKGHPEWKFTPFSGSPMIKYAC